MGKILSLFFSLISIIMFADSPDETLYLQLVGDADEAISKGEYEKAEQLLLDALKLQPANPSNILLVSNLGMVRYYMGEDSLALKTLNDAHEMGPSMITVLMNRARVKSGMGDIKGAIADYNRVSELDSTMVDPYFFRGMIYMSLRDIEEAQKNIIKLKNLSPDSDNTALALATLYVEQNEPKKAIPYFTQLLKTEEAPEYFSARAMCYLMIDELGEASEDIGRGLEIDPADGELYLCRAILNKRRYLIDDAMKDAKKAIELGVDRQRAAALMK